ncbi:MAG TPA: ester cyclase, partial [Aggregatilineales bacterium]|nr:ester cyclase [Aggregatilineales bacterium]
MQKKTDRVVEELAELLAASHQVLETPDANRQRQFASIVKKHVCSNRVLREHDLIDIKASPPLYGRGNHRQHTPIDYVLPSHEQKQVRQTGVKKMISDIWVRRPVLVPSWRSIRLAVTLTAFILLGGTMFFGLIQGNEHPAVMEYLHSPEEVNTDVFERYINDAWNKGGVDILSDIFTEDYVTHDPMLAENITGIEGTKDLITRFRAAMPDLQIVIKATTAERDHVRAQLFLTGTQTSPFELADGTLVPASNNPVMLTITNISRFEGGRIVEMWQQMDTLNLLQQMGIVPQIQQLTTEEQNRELARFSIEQLWGGQGEIDIEDARRVVAESFTQTS